MFCQPLFSFLHAITVPPNYDVILECRSWSWGFLQGKPTGLLAASWDSGELDNMRCSLGSHPCCRWRKLGRATPHPGWRILRREKIANQLLPGGETWERNWVGTWSSAGVLGGEVPRVRTPWSKLLCWQHRLVSEGEASGKTWWEWQ